MRVLVTGGTGFVGRRLCQALIQAGHEVRVLVRPSSEGIEECPQAIPVMGDVTVPESLAKPLEGVEAVFHLAGVTQAGRPSTYLRVNTHGTRHLAAACRGRGLKRFVFMSTLSAQGPSPAGRPHVEAGDEAPINEYGRSKLAAERLLAGFEDLPVTVLRPCVIYGPGDPDMLAWARMVQRRIVPVVSELELSFLHIDDLCELMVSLLEQDDAPFGPYFLSDGQPINMTELIDLLERLSSSDVVVRVPLPPRTLAALIPIVERVAAWSGVGPFTARRLHQLAASGWTCLPEKAREELGFVPKRTLIEALPETFEWYTRHGWLER